MLNAVWRHWIVHPSPRENGIPKGTGAQRRLASLDCSQSHRRSEIQSRRGAQRRLASLDCSHRRRARFGLEYVVLNAVWRHWIVHPPAEVTKSTVNMCSTPLGVIGLFTIRRSSWRPGPRSAQRRLASLDCSHPSGGVRGSTMWCAQRRLASLDCSPPIHAPQLRDEPCAQRRLASLDCSLHLAAFEVLLCGVLNAVWRHWIVHRRIYGQVARTAGCSTPFGVIGLFTEPELDVAMLLRECSTPFGVIGLFTSLRIAHKTLR